MSYCNVFKRYELKYLLSLGQYDKLKALMEAYMRGDRYGESDILNVYYDTPDHLLIRRSLEKPFYKEKLRVRSYGVADKNSKVFIELKKKYDSVVYKRRITVKEREIAAALTGTGGETQIGREIDYFVACYRDLAPKMVISYRREAFYAKEDDGFRMTFDRNILWREENLYLTSPVYGRTVLPEGKILMEVKTAAAFPLWLVKFLSANAVYKTSFSKYGNAYLQSIEQTAKGELKIA